MDEEAERVPAGANGLVFLPHFQGCGSPHWDPDAKGVFYNLTLNTSRGEMIRAMLEGIAMEIKENLELVENRCGTVESVSVSGGMAKSDLFNRIESDVLDRRVTRFNNSEATSLGAWIAGAVATGIETGYARAFSRAVDQNDSFSYKPDSANRETYILQRRRSQALYRALKAPELRKLYK
jgi:sugar (pentulose or hexulose) kinase